MARYLKNNGKPAKVTVKFQTTTAYWDKDGNRKRIDVVMFREFGDNKEAQRMRLTDDEKCVVHYDWDGVDWKYQTRNIRPLTEDFAIEDYPHVMRYPIGETKFDQQLYTIKVGEIAKIESESHFNHLWKAFSFLDEVDEGGKLIAVNEYSQKKKAEKPIDKSEYPRTFGKGEAPAVPSPEKVQLVKQKSSNPDFYTKE